MTASCRRLWTTTRSSLRRWAWEPCLGALAADRRYESAETTWSLEDERDFAEIWADDNAQKCEGRWASAMLPGRSAGQKVVVYHAVFT